MKNRLILWAAVLYSTFAFADQQGVPESIRFRVVRDYLLVVPVSVNGQGPFEFVLDTGSNACLVDPELATSLGLESVQEVQVKTVTGSEGMKKTVADISWFPNAPSKHLPVFISDLKELRSSDRRIRGILGSNFLSQFDFLIDLHARLIRLDRYNIPTGKRQPFEVSQGKTLIDAGVANFATDRLRLSLDSAASELVLFRRTWMANAAAGNQVASTVVGTTSIESYKVKFLTIGAYFAQNLPAALIDLGPQRQGRLEDGLLPLTLFRSVYFCNSQKFVILNGRVRSLFPI